MEEEKEQNEQFMLDLEMHGVSSDWFLRKLVSLVNTTPIEFDVTLTVEGSVISGTLISNEKYFEMFAEQFGNAWPYKEGQESIKESFLNFKEMVKKKDDGETPTYQYINLRAAKYIQGNMQFPKKGALWRGKINAVSGFALGSLNFS